MGLDQYMMKRIQNAEGEGDELEIAYWRKVRHIQNWMEDKWRKEGNSGQFNCVELTMTHELLDELEKDAKSGNLQQYDEDGFFYGSYDFEKEEEEHLFRIISECHEAIEHGFHVYYCSWW